MADAPNLTVALEKVCFLIQLAREYDVKEAVSDPDPGSNATDDAMLSVLEDHEDDPVRSEIVSFIRGLNEDEQEDIVALAWLGRGDGDFNSWDELRAEAARAHNNRTATYLLGMPLLADYLEEALSQLGYSCEDLDSDETEED